MKKATKVSLVAALAVSALTPAMAIGAETNHAAPGFYNVDNGKVVTADAFVLLSNTEKTNLLQNSNVYYADGAGKVVQATKILTASTDAELVAALFPETELEADKNVTLTPEGTVVPGESAGLKVESVKAINATQVEVKFSKSVDEDTVIDAGKVKAANISFTDLPGANNVDLADAASKAELSKDGKILTITAKPTETFEGRYDILIQNVKDVDGNIIEKYDVKNVEFAKDTVAPKVTGYEQVDADNVKINFSKPINTGAVFEFKDENGTVIDTGNALGKIPTPTYATGDKSVTVDLSNIAAGKKVTVTIKNVKDLAGNLIAPQPTTLVIQKQELAAFNPKINTVIQTGAKTFTIKFSEPVVLNTNSPTDVTLSAGGPITKLEKVSDTEYKVTATNNLNDLTTVSIAKANVKDQYGQAAANNLSKLVTFVEDTVVPTATAKLATDKNNKQVLELTFDKDVDIIGAGELSLEGSQVKDYITTGVASVDAVAVYADGKGDNKKVVHVPLNGTGLDVERAAYNLTITNKNGNTNGIISDAGKAMKPVSAKFTRGQNGTPPVQPTKFKATVSNVAVDATVDTDAVNDYVKVTFGQDVDAASATNIINYKIANATIESATIVAGFEDEVILKLKSGSVTDSFERAITIENVKAKNSTVTMDKFTGTVTLAENVAPTTTSAVLTSTDEVTLTFSEAVTTMNVSTDFELLIGGKTVATKDLVTTAAGTGKTVVLTLENDVTTADVNAGLSLKPLSTLDIKDSVGNKLSVPANIKITQ